MCLLPWANPLVGQYGPICRIVIIIHLCTSAILNSEKIRAKYPLSIIAKANEVLPPHLLVAYDIGCAFQKTVESSSLGPKFQALGHRMCVNAFHGWLFTQFCLSNEEPPEHHQGDGN